MRTNLAIAVLLFPVVQAVLFGAGLLFILATPLSGAAMTAIPWMIAATVGLSIPIAWTIAPRLRSRGRRRSA